MVRNTKDTVKNIGTGIAAGLMIGAVSSKIMNDSRKNKKRGVKAIDAVENVLDTIQEMFK